MSAQFSVNVQVAKDFRHRIADVVQRLQAAGMRVERVGEVTGIVSGSVSPEVATEIREMACIQRVATDRAVSAPLY